MTDPVGSDMGQEGSSPTQGENDPTIFWGDDQGPVVIVSHGMGWYAPWGTGKDQEDYQG